MTELSSSEDLLAALKAAGVKGKDIAAHLGIAPSAVSALFKGYRQLKFEEAVRLKSLLGSDKMKDLPLIGLAGAGNWVEAIESPGMFLQVPEALEAPGTFAVMVAGDSMNLMLPEGAFAIIDVNQRELFSGGAYLIKNDDGEATIKMYRNDPARFEPRSTNAEHKPFIIGESPISVVGKVTGALQKF